MDTKRVKLLLKSGVWGFSESVMVCSSSHADRAVVTVAEWTLSGQPTCTPKVGASARSLASWAFIGALSANSS
jgi:hypothetical protein